MSLSTYSAIESALLVHWRYNSPLYGAATFFDIYVSDYYRTIEYNGNTYLPLNRFLQIETTATEIRSNSDTVSITFDGIDPTYNLARFIFNRSGIRLKGSEITIHRAIFDPGTNTLASLPTNPIGRFKGYVQSASISDQQNGLTGDAANSIQLQVADYKAYLQQTTSGRKTQYPDRSAVGDYAFSRVEGLKKTKFEWGQK